MYQAPNMYRPEYDMVSGGLNIVVPVLGGAYGALLKSKAPSKTQNAETLQCTLEACIMFDVS